VTARYLSRLSRRTGRSQNGMGDWSSGPCPLAGPLLACDGSAGGAAGLGLPPDRCRVPAPAPGHPVDGQAGPGDGVPDPLTGGAGPEGPDDPAETAPDREPTGPSGPAAAERPDPRDQPAAAADDPPPVNPLPLVPLPLVPLPLFLLALVLLALFLLALVLLALVPLALVLLALVPLALVPLAVDLLPLAPGLGGRSSGGAVRPLPPSPSGRFLLRARLAPLAPLGEPEVAASSSASAAAGESGRNREAYASPVVACPAAVPFSAASPEAAAPAAPRVAPAAPPTTPAAAAAAAPGFRRAHRAAR
jgi:hypothetical protein